MDHCIELLKQKNIRVTPQRIGVLQLMQQQKKHLTAEEIYEKMKIQFPALSLATVYTILDVYGTHGLVQQMRVTPEKSCYEARTDAHHHFFCKQCHTLLDIDLHPCPALTSLCVDGHRIEKLHGYFYGLCRECRCERGE